MPYIAWLVRQSNGKNGVVRQRETIGYLVLDVGHLLAAVPTCVYLVKTRVELKSIRGTLIQIGKREGQWTTGTFSAELDQTVRGDGRTVLNTI